MTSRTSSLAVSQQCAFAPSTSLVARFAPHVAGLCALLAAAALLMEMRAELVFLRKLSPKSKLKEGFKNDPRQQQTLPPYQLRL